MSVWFSVFAEQGNGNRRQDFDANGQPLQPPGALPLAPTTLDQSINEKLTVNSSLVMLVRERAEDGVLTWVGLYRHDPVLRGGNGNQGAGVWFYKETISGSVILEFLQKLSENWSRLSRSEKESNTSWEAFDDKLALLGYFKSNLANVSVSQPYDLENPEISCVIDLSTEENNESLAYWLDQARTKASLCRRKRIIFVDSPHLATRIRELGIEIFTPCKASSDISSHHSSPIPLERTLRKLGHRDSSTHEMSPINARHQIAASVLGRQPRTGPSILSLSDTRPSGNGAHLSAAIEMLRDQTRSDYEKLSLRVERFEKDKRQRSTRWRFALWASATALVFCFIISLTEFAILVGVVPAAVSPAPAQPELPHGTPSAAVAPPPLPPPPSAQGDAEQTVRKINQLSSQMLKLLPQDKQKLSQAEINELRRLATEIASTGPVAAP